MGAIVARRSSLTPGGATFRYNFFNFHDLLASPGIGDPRLGLSALRDGHRSPTSGCFSSSEVLVLFFALGIAWMRISQTPVLLPFRVLATAYTDVLRGVPLIVIMLLVGYGLPALNSRLISTQSPSIYGVVALTIVLQRLRR